MKKIKSIILISILLISGLVKSQTDQITLIEYWNTVSPSKEEKFSKFIQSNHGFDQNFTTWKKENRFLYIKEFWYYAESFYIKRGANIKGVSIDESQIDISRFESYRKENDEFSIIIDGFKDVIVLLPNSKLIYKP